MYIPPQWHNTTYVCIELQCTVPHICIYYLKGTTQHYLYGTSVYCTTHVYIPPQWHNTAYM